jgi:hypothetical protein
MDLTYRTIRNCYDSALILVSIPCLVYSFYSITAAVGTFGVVTLLVGLVRSWSAN